MEKIKLWQNKEWLEEQYFTKKLSFAKIGKLVGKSGKTIQFFFRKFGLKARPSILGLRGDKSPNWKGGKVYDTHGYIRYYHPNKHDYRAKHIPYVLEHVIVMEKKLGRKLIHPEIVHHNDGSKNNNNPENLRLFSCPKEHNTYEQYLSLFSKKLLYGNLAPHLNKELKSLFNQFLSSLVNER